jgi:inner membrane protein
MRRAVPGPAGLVALAWAAVGVVAVADRWLLTSDAAMRSMVVTGVVDECAHLATAVVVLAATLAVRDLALPAVAVVLAASVALDVDHIPGLLFDDRTLGWDGRPHTHSLAVCAVVVAGAALTPAGRRWLPAAAAAGIGLHLARDLATGPGVPLLWPIDTTPAYVHHGVYMALLLLLAAAATVAAWRRRAQASAARAAEVRA